MSMERLVGIRKDKHSAGIPNYGVWPRGSEDNPDVRFSYGPTRLVYGKGTSADG